MLHDFLAPGVLLSCVFFMILLRPDFRSDVLWILKNSTAIWCMLLFFGPIVFVLLSLAFNRN